MMAASRCPSIFELEAALHVAAVLPAVGASGAQARASYELIPSGGLYRLEDFLSAEAMLRRCKFLEACGDYLTPHDELLQLVSLPSHEAREVLLLAIVERDPPVWALALGNSEGGLAVETIPDDDLHTMESIVTDEARREEFLLALGRRVDSEEIASIGAAGEEFVLQESRVALMALGRADLAARARRVSLISDQLGYDIIAPSVAGGAWRIEVKTTRTSTVFARVIVTRNEARIGLKDVGWVLVVCLLKADGSHEIAGWCRAQAFAELLPVDPPENGGWMSASIFLHTDSLHQGLPDLAAGPSC
jgi:hypothetical protein